MSCFNLCNILTKFCNSNSLLNFYDRYPNNAFIYREFSRQITFSKEDCLQTFESSGIGDLRYFYFLV